LVNSWSGSIKKRLHSALGYLSPAEFEGAPATRDLTQLGKNGCFGWERQTPLHPFPRLSRRSGLHPCVALSSAQVLPEWTISTPPCNDFSANGDYPLNFVSRKTDHFKATGNPQLMLDSPGTGFTSRSYKPAPPVFLSRNLCSVPLIEAPLGPPDLFAARVFKPGEVETIPGAPLPAPPCK